MSCPRSRDPKQGLQTYQGFGKLRTCHGFTYGSCKRTRVSKKGGQRTRVSKTKCLCDHFIGPKWSDQYRSAKSKVLFTKHTDIHSHKHTYTHAYTPTLTPAHAPTPTHSHTRTYAHTYIYIYTHIYIYTCVSLSIYAFVFVCTYYVCNKRKGCQRSKVPNQGLRRNGSNVKVAHPRLLDFRLYKPVIDDTLFIGFPSSRSDFRESQIDTLSKRINGFPGLS